MGKSSGPDFIHLLTDSELIWAVYAVVGAMEDCNRDDWRDVQIGWQQWLDYSKTTAATVRLRLVLCVCLEMS